MPDMSGFEGKTALVTGGGSGIGRAVAIQLAARGAKVMVTGRRAEPLEDVVREITTSGANASLVAGDIAVESDVVAMVDHAVTTYGSLDLACNNAAEGGGNVPVSELAAEAFDHTIAVNLRGAFLCMRYETRQMLKQGSGSIVNISSVNAVRPEPNYAAYCASKAALESLTQTVGLEMAPQGIRVNAVRPGYVITPMHERSLENAGGSREELIREIDEEVPIKRRGEPNDIAAAVLWLMSDEASYVTSSVLTVDGGVSFV
jgi:NAD(P)-dependent dehydrogenase (short-subunit alcohol dehydrogenase family)